MENKITKIEKIIKEILNTKFDNITEKQQKYYDILIKNAIWRIDEGVKLMISDEYFENSEEDVDDFIYELIHVDANDVINRETWNVESFEKFLINEFQNISTAINLLKKI